MKAERWQQIEKLYHAALELGESQRSAFLDDACAGDEALRREVESLLAFESRAENFIESPALEVAATMLGKDEAIPTAGKQVGPYQVLSLIGTGGMGEVYLAQDRRLGRKVALKVLPKQFTQDAARVRRFEQEARAASALNHPNIITIFEIGQTEETHYIATEYIEGHTLREHGRLTRIRPSQALDIACQIASALAAAHEAGIIHRDIKPENIMLRPDGYVKVLDFGIAKLTEAYATSSDMERPTPTNLTTEAGTVLGTASYMSPEQARGQKIDARTDLFSLGVVLYEIIAGQTPFAGATSADVIAAILTREPPPLARLTAEVPEALDWIISKALRKDRDERYQTAKELQSDLKNLSRRLEFEEELKRSMGVSPAGADSASGPEQAFAKASLLAPQSSEAKSRKVIDSLAALPLVNTCEDPGMEYFSDGITESIINTLSRLPDLHVMAWSTVSRYKNQPVDPREVGRNLGVRAVLTGRLIQMGESLILKTELVDAADGSHLWAETCSCNPSDVLALEEGICKEISEKLLLRLTTEEKRRLTKRYTENVEAYHAYLKGRYFWNKRTDESVRQGIEYFKQAIDSDPSYALAYAGLADSYIILSSGGIATLAPGEAYPKAREAAVRALEIDDTLAEAHASLAMSLAYYYWDWPAAEKEFKRSIELKPGYTTAHHWYGFIYLVARGLLDEAIREVKRAHELDPLALGISTDLGLLYYLGRQYDQAIDEYQKTLEMDQNFVYSHWKLGLAYEQKGMYEEAIAELQRAIALSGRSLLPMAQLGHVYAVSGKIDEALAVLHKLNELSKHRYVSPYRIAMIYVGLGEKDQAFEWLERAYRERDGWLSWLLFDPVLDPIRSDERFKNLLSRIGLGGAQPTEMLSRKVTLPAPQSARSRKRPSRASVTSLAILPLTNNCDDPGMEYLSDGITESIINMLSQLPKLRVVARSTAFRYKGREVDPQEVGRELGVQAVLTGRVRQMENRLAIATELIAVADDSHIWGEHFNRSLSDIFDVQEEIAREIAGKLRLKLTRKDKGRITKRHTENVQAYQAYLKGRYFWNKRTTESLNRGIEYFRQAIDLDPSYASAYAGLSDSYTLLVVRESLSPEEGFAKAKAAAAMALKIDEQFAEAHASLGHAMLHNWEWDAAERELKKAIELNPGYPSAHHWYSEHLTAMGRCDESIAELKLAGELDPLSLVISADLGRAFYYARDYDQVIKQEARTLEMDSSFWLSHINVGRSYTQKGMHAEAISALEQARQLSAGNTEVLSFLGFAYAAAGKIDKAFETLRQLEEQSKHSYVPPYHLAIVHAGLGEKDRAFEWLERSFEKHAVDLFTLKVEPMFDGLRSDPRFDDLLRRVGLASQEKQESAAYQSALRAIAVLPFRPINVNQRDEYLELGMADALITRLSSLSQIVVRSTNAVRKYTELETDSVTAGRELRVESVLEGCIQRLGDSMRVTTRLIRVEDGVALWADRFDEKATDIFAVQDSIAERVTAALALKLTTEERDRLTKRYTENTEAYHLYLKGRYHWNKRSEEALNKAIECFREAIDLDPNYALAYAGLADCYTKLGDVGITAMIPKEAFAQARAAALRALQIDSSLAEVHASLGHLDMHQLRWADAERDFKRAIELNPNYVTAHHWYAYYMAFHRRFDEALEKIETALKLDPLSLPIVDSVGEFLYFARRNDEAIKQFHKALEMDPDFLASLINLGRAYEEAAMFSAAEEQFVKARQITAESIDALAALGHTYAMSGNTGAALGVLAQLMELSKERYVSPYDIALIHAVLGESDEAFRWLEKAYDECAEWVIFTNADPRLDPLRADARFSRLLRRLGFAP